MSRVLHPSLASVPVSAHVCLPCAVTSISIYIHIYFAVGGAFCEDVAWTHANENENENENASRLWYARVCVARACGSSLSLVCVSEGPTFD